MHAYKQADRKAAYSVACIDFSVLDPRCRLIVMAIYFQSYKIRLVLWLHMKRVSWSFPFTLVQNLLYLFSSHHEGKIYSGEAIPKSAWKDKLYPEEQTAWYDSQRDAAPILSQSCWPLEKYTVFRLHCIHLQIIPLLKPLQNTHIYGPKSLRSGM